MGYSLFDGEPIWKSDRIDERRSVCTTTAGESFTYGETCVLASLIFKRFGNSPEAAAFAWRRLMQNDASEGDFMRLVNDYENIVRERQIDAAMERFSPGRGH